MNEPVSTTATPALSAARVRELRRRPNGVKAAMLKYRDAHPQEAGQRQRAREHERAIRSVTSKLAKLDRRQQGWAKVLADLEAHAPKACSAKARHHLANNRRLASRTIERILEQKRPLEEQLTELRGATPEDGLDPEAFTP